MLARLVGSGLRNLFFCESSDGSLQQVTQDMARSIDLNVFSGVFRCCVLKHNGRERCDRERLRTPILGIYSQYCRQRMSHEGCKIDAHITHLFPTERFGQDKEQMFPRFFDYVTANHDLTSSVQVQELFGPLPEMLEQRVRSSSAAVNDINTSCTVGRSGAASVHEGQAAVIQPNNTSQGRTSEEAANVQQERRQLGKGEIVDRDDVPAEVVAGCQLIGTSPCTSSSKDTVSLRDGDKERGMGSVESVENNHILKEQDEGSISDQELSFESELV